MNKSRKVFQYMKLFLVLLFLSHSLCLFPHHLASYLPVSLPFGFARIRHLQFSFAYYIIRCIPWPNAPRSREWWLQWKLVVCLCECYPHRIALFHWIIHTDTLSFVCSHFWLTHFSHLYLYLYLFVLFGFVQSCVMVGAFVSTPYTLYGTFVLSWGTKL